MKLEKEYLELPQFSGFKGEIVWQKSLKADQNATGGEFVDGKLLFGTTQNWIYAHNAFTGEKLDRMWANLPVEIPPAVDDSLLFYAGAGEWNELVAANIYSGKELWNKTARTIGSKILSSDSTIYYATSSGGIYRLNQKTGEIIAKRRINIGISCDLLIIGDELFIGTRDGNIYILDRFELTISKKLSVGSPVAEKFHSLGNKIFTNLENGDLLIIDRKELKIVKTIQQQGEFVTAPLILNNLIIAVNNAGVVSCHQRLEPYEFLWEIRLHELQPEDFDSTAGYQRSGEASVFASPATLYGKIIIITYRGSLFVIDPETSEIELAKKIGGRFVKSPQTYGSMLYLFSENSRILGMR